MSRVGISATLTGNIYFLKENKQMKLKELKSSFEAPQWLTEEGFITLTKGYLLPGETPKDMYRRVARAAASYLPKDQQKWEDDFFNIIWNNWLCLSTPVASNFGAERGLPISCFGSYVDDSIFSIFHKNLEVAVLSKHGGGTSSFLGDVRGRGAAINGGGNSNGTTSWVEVLRTTVNQVSQNGIRRGQHATYIPIDHGDFDEFVDVRKHLDGIHLGVSVTDAFLKKCENGDPEALRRWFKLLKARMETGEPYILFIDRVNEQNPKMYKDLGLSVKASNLCSEITLHSDIDHSFVCCLSSMNLAKWDEWKDTNAVFLATVFLDCVMEEFIKKASKIRGIEAAVNFAKKSRALGLGVLGYHTYLQKKMIPFDSLQARIFNHTWAKTLKMGAQNATEWMASELGEPEWCKGHGVRNTHLLAIAPTTSNAIISGGVSQGIEPIVANAYVQKTAKGTFIRKNPTLEEYLDNLGLNTNEVWEKIIDNNGSISEIDGISEEAKEVFKTAYEINQKEIIFQANQRQKYICQSQSLNLFFDSNESPEWIHKIHKEAAMMPFIKSLYYVRSMAGIKAEKTEACKSCEA